MKVENNNNLINFATVDYGMLFKSHSDGNYYMRISPATDKYNVVNVENSQLGWFPSSEQVTIYEAVIDANKPWLPFK